MKSVSADVVTQLMNAISRGDLDVALALYEPDAVFLAEPGKPVRGQQAIREVLQGFIALEPTLSSLKHRVIEQGDVALYFSQWSLKGTGPDGKPVQMSGVSSDVLRRQSDGTWLIIIDNPWGTAILA